MSFFAKITPLHKKLLLLFAIGICVYLPSLNNQFIWDDEQFIYENVFVQSFDIPSIFTTSTTSGAGIESNYYRPLTTLSFAWDHAWWGFTPFGFHLTNTLLHASAGVLLFLFLREIKVKENIAFWVSVIFLVHPLQTESVVYANSRGDSLYVFFAFLTLLLFSILSKKKSIVMRIYDRSLTFTKTKLVVLCSLGYLATILSKEIGLATLGLLYLTFFLYIFQQKTKNITVFDILRNSKAHLVTLALQTSIAVGYLALRATSLNFQNTFGTITHSQLYDGSLLIRMLTFSKILWIYFKLLLLPFPLHMERTTDIVSNPASPWTIATITLFVSILLIGIWEYKKLKTIWWWYGWAWFFAMLVPVSGIIPINGLLYEHWLYLPQVGFFLAVFSLLHGVYCLYSKGKEPVTKRISITKNIPKITTAVLITATVIFASLALRQNYLWGDPVRFYEYTLQHTSSARLYSNLGMAYGDVNNCAKAIPNYTKAIEINPNYPQTYHNLGNCYGTVGNLEQAQTNYEQALEIQPDFYYSYGPLLEIYLATGQKEKALKIISKALEMQPSNEQLVLLQEQLTN